MILRVVWTFLKGLFILFCIVGAVFMTVFLVYQYTLDEDVSSINFRPYHVKQNVYPSITMCIGDTDSVFKTIGGFNQSAYKNFLSGCDEQLLGCSGCCNMNVEGPKYEHYSN